MINEMHNLSIQRACIIWASLSNDYMISFLKEK
jgi:hypothetical protein